MVATNLSLLQVSDLQIRLWETTCRQLRASVDFLQMASVAPITTDSFVVQFATTCAASCGYSCFSRFARRHVSTVSLGGYNSSQCCVVISHGCTCPYVCRGMSCLWFCCDVQPPWFVLLIFVSTSARRPVIFCWLVGAPLLGLVHLCALHQFAPASYSGLFWLARRCVVSRYAQVTT